MAVVVINQPVLPQVQLHDRPYLIGYWLGYAGERENRRLRDLPIHLLTHIHIFLFEIHFNPSIALVTNYLTSESNERWQEILSDVHEIRHRYPIKFIASILDNSYLMKFGIEMTDKQLDEWCYTVYRKVVIEWQLDGIDLDFESTNQFDYDMNTQNYN
ncbi:unnamed protein product [Didymodactylos carnosus]|uniref:GH18 domain-containing protein n=1 Tax=Didymodactylos carnosus TaxID=1234261 RepID=A0A814JE76_9BILA|nr:unnamed protein product [Didymodactylos carnosus]CAF1034411.1 unnamed protein product [Didymodactylos carnosus]CAF3620858.1 unnamed protein product [Didymodactylos carnosus]CAF3805057.1 unnamed protein product [Didymodactylos carnosus]